MSMCGLQALKGNLDAIKSRMSKTMCMKTYSN